MYLALLGLSGLLLVCFQGLRVTGGYSTSRIVVETNDTLPRLACYTCNSISTLSKLNQSKGGKRRMRKAVCKLEVGGAINYLSAGRATIQEPDVVMRALQPTQHKLRRSRVTTNAAQDFPTSVAIRYKESGVAQWFWPFGTVDAEALQQCILDQNAYQVSLQTRDSRADLVYAPFAGVVSLVRLRKDQPVSVCLSSMDGRVKICFGGIGALLVANRSRVKKGMPFVCWGRQGEERTLSISVERDGKSRRPIQYILSRCNGTVV